MHLIDSAREQPCSASVIQLKLRTKLHRVPPQWFLHQSHHSPHWHTQRSRGDSPDTKRNGRWQGLSVREKRLTGARIESKIGGALIREEEAIAGDYCDEADDIRVDSGGASNRGERDGDERCGRLPAHDEAHGKAEQRQYDDKHDA